MSQQFLHRADVIASLKEMRREAVSERLRTNGLHDARTAARLADSALRYRLVLVMPAALAAARVSRDRRGRKHPLPAPLAIRVGILARQRVRQEHAAEAR